MGPAAGTLLGRPTWSGNITTHKGLSKYSVQGFPNHEQERCKEKLRRAWRELLRVVKAFNTQEEVKSACIPLYSYHPALHHSSDQEQAELLPERSTQ